MKNMLISLLQQLQDCIDLTPQNIYVKNAEGISSIGCHTRHCINHFESFFESLETQKINYDKRNRDKALETDKALAAQCLGRFIINFESWSNYNLHQKLELSFLTDVAHESWATVNTTFEREGHYLAMHTLHHLSFMKLLAKSHDLQWPAHIGVACSTQVYEQCK